MDGTDGTVHRAPLTRRPPPSRADKVRRGLWQLVALFLFRPSPVPFHGWRRVLLRLFGAQIGPHAAVYPSVNIWAPWNLHVGAGVTVGGGATLYTVDIVKIGAGAIISQGAHLCTASHDHHARAFDLVTAPIVVEADAWVAAEAFVGPGVVIAEGAVVGARAVTLRSVAPRAIVAGNPARVVGMRDAAGRNQLSDREAKKP